jgi:hypothetical protein
MDQRLKDAIDFNIAGKSTKFKEAVFDILNQKVNDRLDIEMQKSKIGSRVRSVKRISLENTISLKRVIQKKPMLLILIFQNQMTLQRVLEAKKLLLYRVKTITLSLSLQILQPISRISQERFMSVALVMLA